MKPKRRAEDVVEHEYFRKHILLTAFSYFTLALSTIALFVVIFWLFYPYNVVSFSPKVFPVNKTAVAQGGTIDYSFKYQKFMDVLPTTTKSFVDGLVFNSDSPGVALPIGSGLVASEVDIPETLPPGRYKIRITLKYQVNPIRAITYTNETESFEVIQSGHPDADQDK